MVDGCISRGFAKGTRHRHGGMWRRPRIEDMIVEHKPIEFGLVLVKASDQCAQE